MEFGVVLQGTKSCVPDSVSCARWLAANDRHAEAIAKLNQIVREWPLNREAHRMLISELQRAGNSAAADRAAAEFLAIAPNARNFRRMAQSAELAQDDVNGVPFYQRYRRPAPAAVAVTQEPATPTVILLQDKVAIARRDGSVSLYMHRVVQVLTSAGGLGYRPLAIPDGAEVLTARVVNREASSDQETQTASLQPGDEIEEEFVVNYTGDGGMISHPEAFQYVFNDFDSPLLDARFVVLSPAGETPAYVIASGNVPSSDVESYGGLRAQIWQRKAVSAETGDLRCRDRARSRERERLVGSTLGGTAAHPRNHPSGPASARSLKPLSTRRTQSSRRSEYPSLSMLLPCASAKLVLWH